MECGDDVVTGLLQLRLERFQLSLGLLRFDLDVLGDGFDALAKHRHVGGDFGSVLVGQVDDWIHGCHDA